MSHDYIVGYRFTPVMRSEFSGMQVSSSSSCPVSRQCISGSGGRRDVISKQVKDLILTDRLTQELVRMRMHELRLQNLKNDTD